MTKTKSGIAILCLLAAFNIFADTPDDTQKQKQQTTKEEKSQSMYDSIKSGWNSMLDAVMGPANNNPNE